MDKKYFDTRKGSLEDKINNIASEQPTINATYKPDVKLSTEKKYFETKPGSLADIAAKVVSESKLDPVNKDAVKKKFDDRKDKDIDNDGDVDSSDKFLHKRRKAISKAVNKEEVANEVVETIAKKNLSMREALSQVWNNGYDKLKNSNPFEQFGANTPTSNQGVKTVARDKAAPKMGNASGPNRSNPNKKPINSSKTETGKPITKIEVNPKV